MDWTKNLIVGFDTETTGLHPVRGRVIQYGFVVLDPTTGEVLDRMYDLCGSDGVPIDPGAQKANGITAEMIAGKPTFDSVLAGIREKLSKLGTYTALAYNAPFDLAFLGAADKRLGRDAPLFDAKCVLDPLLIARRFRPYGNKLTEVCGRIGVCLGNAHDASADAEAAVRCMLVFRAKDAVPADLDEALAVQDEARIRWDARTRHRYWDTFELASKESA